ncbi:MAG: DUF99 family protein [Euryarchaeota archaeon]|nr:DUF99 family protein [Euryarchaeota archaeon]
MSLRKPGIRALGIAESFSRARKTPAEPLGGKSVVAGVVLRADGALDGAALSEITVGGMDATRGVLDLLHTLHREDLQVVLLGGCVWAWFNIVDLQEVARAARAPLVCITYEESRGLDKYLKEYFPGDWEERLAAYRSLGQREPTWLPSGHSVYVRSFGLTRSEVQEVLGRFTRHGRVPEPIRVARLVARAALRHWGSLRSP